MSFALKLLAGLLLVLVAGVPVLETWKALLLAAGGLALVFGVNKPGGWRLGVAVGVVILVVGLKALLPRADIAEAHNPFKVIQEGEVLQQGLPPEVFANWKKQFDAVYPPDKAPYAARSVWRLRGVPKTLFTKSSDSIWRKAKYTRQVDSIDFRSLGEFRAGFANELQYNYWTGELLREWMPFYVMYELTPASAGSRMAWKGQVFWERASGSFEEIVHGQVAEKEIAPEDAGKRIYAVFFPKVDPKLYFALNPSLKLLLSGWVDALLSIIGWGLVLWLMVRPRWAAYLRTLLLYGVSYMWIAIFIMMMAIFIPTSAGEYLGKTYPPHSGGNDGMLHDGFGREMAMMVAEGRIVDALRGQEAVYWFTPGTRYFRMVEKLVFGDTNHGYALFLACVPVVIFYLIRHFIGTRWAWAMTVVFCFLLVGNFSYPQYLHNAKIGYGEALGGGLYLLSLALMLRTQPRWGGADKSLPMVWVAGAALAASMFVRPNFAYAVVWLGAAHAWASWRNRDFASIAALSCGLGLALWMPFHNWFYGGEFYLISKSGSTISVPLGVGDYWSALGDVLRGRFADGKVPVIAEQLKGWLFGASDVGLTYVIKQKLIPMPLAWAFHGVKLLALVVTCWVILRWGTGGFKRGTDLAMVAIAAVCALIPLMFIFSTHYRYAMLGWDLCLVVLIVWMARLMAGWKVATEGQAGH